MNDEFNDSMHKFAKQTQERKKNRKKAAVSKCQTKNFPVVFVKANMSTCMV